MCLSLGSDQLLLDVEHASVLQQHCCGVGDEELNSLSRETGANNA